VVAVVVVVLLMRAASAPGPGRGLPASRPPRGPRPTARPVAPDDDPDFLRELERRARRDDNPKA
jgi:hypothetical protein